MEEKIKKDEEGNVLEKTEIVKVEEVLNDIPVNANSEAEVFVEGVPELPVEEGLTEEEKMALDEIANAPGQLEKSSKRKSKG